MTSVLRDLQAEYDQRAQQALQAPVSPADEKPRRKATRTYTEAQLEAKRAWGRCWGGMNAEHARKLRAGEVD